MLTVIGSHLPAGLHAASSNAKAAISSVQVCLISDVIHFRAVCPCLVCEIVVASVP